MDTVLDTMTDGQVSATTPEPLPQLDRRCGMCADPATENRNKPRVLIVDDTKAIQSMFRVMLKPFCTKISTMASGEEFLEAVLSDEGEKIDVVVLDNNMDGIEALEEARQKNFCGQVIMCSGDEDPEKILRFTEQADVVMHKSQATRTGFKTALESLNWLQPSRSLQSE